MMFHQKREIKHTNNVCKTQCFTSANEDGMKTEANKEYAEDEWGTNDVTPVCDDEMKNKAQKMCKK